MSEQSERLAGKMNLRDTFRLWNEARLACNGIGLCASLISSAKRLKVPHTHTHVQLLYGKRFEYREKIKYIFTLDENKMRRIIRANHKFSDLLAVHFFCRLIASWKSTHAIKDMNFVKGNCVAYAFIAHAHTHTPVPMIFFCDIRSKRREKEINASVGNTTEAISTSWKCQCYRYMYISIIYGFDSKETAWRNAKTMNTHRAQKK